MKVFTMKGNVFPVNAMAAYKGGSGIAPLILNLKLNSDYFAVLPQSVG
jgi:hypothetical protein